MRPVDVSSPSPGSENAHDKLFLFGTPRLRYKNTPHEEVLEWRGDTALLGMLASRPGWQSREAVAVLLRPDIPLARARSYLRGLLHRLRAQLPQLNALEVESDRIRWAGECDVQEFDHAIDLSAWEAAINLHTDALASNVGPCGIALLDDWYFDERIRIRQRLELALRAEINTRRNPLLDCSLQMLMLADEQWVDEHALHFLLSTARTASERHLAGAAFTRFAQSLEAEHKESVDPALQALYRTMLSEPSELPVEDRPAPAAAPPQEALANQDDLRNRSASHLLGRDAELGELAALLGRPEIRVLNIHGLGGVGKTLLAKKLFELNAGPKSPEFIWIALQGKGVHEEGLLSVIRHQLGVPMAETEADAWKEHWFQEPRVVFLDGLEASPFLVEALRDLLQVSSGTQFVITCRMVLGIPEEHRFMLKGLAYREGDSPAARLFRQQAARFGAEINAQQAPVVHRIVTHLEGIPLAIELAASWTMLLSVEEIYEQLQQGSPLLDTRVSGDQQTMASVFQSLWNTLTAPERSAFAALSVVNGPMDFATARVLADAEPRVLLRLVNYSLLQKDGAGSLRVPFLLKQLAVTTAEPEALRQAKLRHAAHYLGKLAQGSPVKLGQMPAQPLAAIHPVFDDIVFAWRCAVDEERFDLIADAAESMLGILFAESRFELARELTSYALARLPAAHPLYPILSAFKALAAFRLGRMDEAQATAEKGLACDPQGTALGLLYLAVSQVERFHGQHESALANVERALEAVSDGDAFVRMRIREDYAVCHLTIGNAANAERELFLNLVAARSLAAPYVEGRALTLLGSAKDAMGQHIDALACYDKALAIFRALHDGYQIAYCHRSASYAHSNLGDAAQQMRKATLALQGFRDGGHVHELSESIYAVALARFSLGETEAALATCKEALQMSLKERRLPTTLRCIWALGTFLLPTHRETGVAAIGFAFSHPSLRSIDRAYIQRRFEAQGILPTDLPDVKPGSSLLDIGKVIQMLLGTKL